MARSATSDRTYERHPKEVLLRVSNAPLRERFLYLEKRGVMTASILAGRLGWFVMVPGGGRSNGKRYAAGDMSRVRRTLGIAPESDRCAGGGRGRPRGGLRQAIRYELAVQIAFALGMDPHEAGV